MLHFWRDRFLRVQFLKGIVPCLESRPSTSDSLHFQVPKRFFAFVRPGRQSYASRHELWRSGIVHHGQDWEDASTYDATPSFKDLANVSWQRMLILVTCSDSNSATWSAMCGPDCQCFWSYFFMLSPFLWIFLPSWGLLSLTLNSAVTQLRAWRTLGRVDSPRHTLLSIECSERPAVLTFVGTNGQKQHLLLCLFSTRFQFSIMTTMMLVAVPVLTHRSILLMCRISLSHLHCSMRRSSGLFVWTSKHLTFPGQNQGESECFCFRVGCKRCFKLPDADQMHCQMILFGE